VPPPDFLNNPTSGLTYNAFSQSSYAGVVGTWDIFRWWCGCPVSFVDGNVCTGNIALEPNGVFGYDASFSLRDITDGTSMTLLVGEFARFRNDPDPFFNQWSSAIYYSSNTPGVSRPQGLATTGPRINADLLVPDPNQTDPIAWTDDPLTLEFGQFGFRSQHPGGAHFCFGDGSVRMLKDSINSAIYLSLGTRNGREVVSSDAY